MDRPAWNKLIEAVRIGHVSRVVCWRIDRLGRTSSGLTALFDDLRERKVNLVSLKDGIDLSTAAGKMLAGVLASVAAFETEVRAERVLAGQAVAKANGKKWGGSKKGRRGEGKGGQVNTVKRMATAGGVNNPIAARTR